MTWRKSKPISRRAVTFDEGASFAKKNGLMFFETSAKTDLNVQEAFKMSAIQILEKKLVYEDNEKVSLIRKKKASSWCCE